MTSKISLFNKGIYKSTLRRYAWGSVLYFILLFMVTAMVIMLSFSDANRGALSYYRTRSILLSNEFILIPMLISMAVPTVVGLLAFRFMHSKKASIFVHSLPVKREANYVSTVLASLTLMALPVALNAIVLILMSLGGYGELFSVADCLVWLLYNLLSQLIMFSGVCFSAVITGNSFAMIPLNVLFHTICMIIVYGFSSVCTAFLYGYASSNSVSYVLSKTNFPMSIANLADGGRTPDKEAIISIIISVIAALIIYLISLLLYKKRRLEKCEDVAGFDCLNPIFKYLATFVAALVAFGMFSYQMQSNKIAFWIIVAIISAVVYFATQMLLKKSLRVHSSYKGYLAFATVFTAIILIFAKTSFFGYETRVPDKADVKEAAFYEYYRWQEPFTSDQETISKILTVHGMLSNSEEMQVDHRGSFTYVHIKYNLKNGKTMHRRYLVKIEKYNEIMTDIYRSMEYKKSLEDIFEPMETVMYADVYLEKGSLHMTAKDDLSKLVECIRSDVERLSYKEIYGSKLFAIDFQFVSKEPKDKTLDDSARVCYISQPVNNNFTKTIEWLKENDYWEQIEKSRLQEEIAY